MFEIVNLIIYNCVVNIISEESVEKPGLEATLFLDKTMEGKGKRCSEISNIAPKLHSREIGNKLALRNDHSLMKLRNFQLQEEFDICYQYRNQTFKIDEIVTAHGIIFALAESGLCAAYDRDTNKRLCYLNSSPQELIETMFYNKINNSLVTISAQPDALDTFSMKIRTTPLECIRRAQPDAGFAIFEGQNLLVIDNIDWKALAFSAQDHIYKVFDLKNYTLLHSISDKEIKEIRMTPGLMLLISERSTCGSILLLKILSLEDGTVLKSVNLTRLPNKRINFVQLFHDKILVKQENECVQMVDVQNEKMIELRKQEFEKPTVFIFLYGKRLFLTIHSGTVYVWNLQGDLIASYRDYLLRDAGGNVHLIRDDEMLIYYNKSNGLIKISDSLTGNCCAEIGGNVGISCRNRPSATLIQSSVEDALEDITAFFYDEERNEIYTGNSRGFVHVWSS